MTQKTKDEQVTQDRDGHDEDIDETALGSVSQVLQDDDNHAFGDNDDTLAWQERERRNQFKHVEGLGELEDVTEVEYRKVRLERVILVGVYSSNQTTQEEAEESLRELAALAQTAGADVLDGLLQQRDKPDPATYVGAGKARELSNLVASRTADTIIVDDDLHPSQRRALEDVTKVKVVDRTALILDIFAQHATSREGKAQVQLAQLEYMLPRLRGWGASLSRQAGGQAAGQSGGIGSRGPGETKIETDRRVIRRQISRLKQQIKYMAPARDVKRGSRRRSGLPTVAVVGYTNAGKSLLTNRLTGSQELVENALFATLDTAVRRAKTSDGRMYALVDTVGFVRRLPTQLVEAFKSTLEEVGQADVIMHVVDSSHPDPFSQIEAVEKILSQVEGTAGLPSLLVFNKADRMDAAMRERIHHLESSACIVSAVTEEGLDDVRYRLEQLLPKPSVRIEAKLPYSEGSLLSQVRQYGVVESATYQADGIDIVADVDERLASRIMQITSHDFE